MTLTPSEIKQKGNPTENSFRRKKSMRESEVRDFCSENFKTLTKMLKE